MASLEQCESEDTAVCLWQPHILSRDALLQLLQRRCVHMRDLHLLTTDQLVEMFECVIVPLPQRRYRDNRRGRLLTRLRNKQDNRQRHDGDPDAVGTCMSSSQERLKPPPEAPCERKRICLSGPQVANGKCMGDGQGGSVNGEHDGRRPPTCAAGDTVKVISSSKIVLKRSHSSTVERSPCPEPDRRKEKKKITWP